MDRVINHDAVNVECEDEGGMIREQAGLGEQ